MIKVCEIVKNPTSNGIKIIVETNNRIINIPLDPQIPIPYELYLELRKRIESKKCKNSAKVRIHKILMILDQMAKHSIRKGL
jgi:hypothetical protein